ncbi:hypothetical protein BBJ28_00000116 [Nothophytophthora sp. Chile5]|nr:hypothetical protein BBJ28_00000116 [Nothophytophthora sp. Chile5]
MSRTEMATTMETRAAVAEGNMAKLQLLLDGGANLDAKDEDERTPLHWACATGRVEVAEFLLDHVHAKLSVQDDAGWTPLMSAASAGHGDVVNTYSSLLSGCRLLWLWRLPGNSPLHLAIAEGHEDIARFLLENDANPYAKNKEQQRCVDLATTAFRAEIQALVAKKKGVEDP